MLTKRIIACMDVRDGQVVKGVQFQQLRHAGDPADLAERYNVEGIDEVVILDITATLESRQALAKTIDAVAKRIFLPLTVGGGIRSEDDAAAAVDAGADKVSLNTAALKNPQLISTLARRYGSQAVIVAIDAKSVRLKPDAMRYEVFARSGQASTRSSSSTSPRRSRAGRRARIRLPRSRRRSSCRSPLAAASAVRKTPRRRSRRAPTR